MFQLTTDLKVIDKCALLMSESEPWTTLERNFERCVKSFKGDSKEIYVAMEGETVIAFAILQMSGTFRGYIQTVYVNPEKRGMGIGSKLLKFCEERIFKDSANVFICVSSFNRKAQKLYYGMGYTRVGEMADFIVEGHSEILLRKTIGSLTKFELSKKT
jgi:ribosomal-protein-alanine N-acetyltransferase